MMGSISGNESVSDIGQIIYQEGSASRFELRRAGVIRFIDRFLAGDLSAEQIVDIASMLEMNDRILLDEVDRSVVTEALFQLSSPEINGPVTESRAEEVRKKLIA
jgi:hypothetical protein